jgi:hypothetical protein
MEGLVSIKKEEYVNIFSANTINTFLKTSRMFFHTPSWVIGWGMCLGTGFVDFPNKWSSAFSLLSQSVEHISVICSLLKL